VTPKLFKAADVCEIAQVQPYMLRSWEKEFPGIGVETTPDAPKFYRQSDVEQVLRIRQLVFGEGLTVAGARRRLEEAGPADADADERVSEALDQLGAAARKKIAGVREGLRAIHALLAQQPGSFELAPPPASRPKKKSAPVAPLRAPQRGKAATSKSKPVPAKGKARRSR
jgi:DNA-binding transcriptional MerR regulator